MPFSPFLLVLITIPLTLHAAPSPLGFLIDCGAPEGTNINGVQWIPDDGFITVGNRSTLKTPNLVPFLESLRYFPDKSARKYCFHIPVIKGGRYLVRTTYFYGEFDGGKNPPVFDQIIDGSKWNTVDMSDDYLKGLSSYYEIIVEAGGKSLSVCLARNEKTVSDPFISALEVGYLEPFMYNSTDFDKYALSTVARHRFGHSGKIMGFPDDPFNRYWQPFRDDNPAISSNSNVSSSDFWNRPPATVFQTALTTSTPKTMQLQWPTRILPSANYYMILYFQDARPAGSVKWRVFDVSINGVNFYSNLNVTTTGVAVFATNWPLAGLTNISLIPASGSSIGPLINGGELFQIMRLGGRTVTRDVIAMEDVARSLDNPPSDWSGDPCLPRQNSWTGVKCSQDKLARVISLNITGLSISGSLSPSIANLTALTDLWLADNKLSGSIPDLSPLKQLVSLHLENNQFSGKIPQTLGDLQSLHELFLQNNNLSGQVPNSLRKRTGLNLQVSPGNNIISLE